MGSRRVHPLERPVDSIDRVLEIALESPTVAMAA
jgi:hypothetical protein